MGTDMAGMRLEQISMRSAGRENTKSQVDRRDSRLQTLLGAEECWDP